MVIQQQQLFLFRDRGWMWIVFVFQSDEGGGEYRQTKIEMEWEFKQPYCMCH